MTRQERWCVWACCLCAVLALVYGADKDWHTAVGWLVAANGWGVASIIRP